MVDDRDTASKNRIAHNEAVFRAVNERVADVQDQESRTTEFLCECGNLDCTEVVAMSDTEYAHVRSDSRTFAVVPGHELAEVESIVARTDRFNVVQKHEEQAAIAEATDPSV